MKYQLIFESLVSLWTALIISGMLTLIATGTCLFMLAVLWPLEERVTHAVNSNE